MATRRSLYSDLLSTWANKLVGDGLLTAAVKSNIDNDLNIDDFMNAIAKIKPAVTGGFLKSVLDKMDETRASEELLDEEIPVALSYKKEEVQTHRVYCLKDFSYASPNGELYVLTSSLFKEAAARTSILDNDWKAIELLFLTNATEPDFPTSLSADLANDKPMVYVLTDQPAADVWRLYSYAYLCHINKGSVAVPTELGYASSTPFINTGISYDSNVKYEQYFEAYHVMNEAKHVNDILGRYLRMYQVLELFVYRHTLVSIEKANNKNTAFVRNVIKEAYKTGSDEKKQFVEGVSKVFPNMGAIITEADVNPYNGFLDNIYQIKSGDPHSTKKVAKIIYALRNSVVHNKESELHFSFGNVDEYRDGVGLMKVMIPKLEEAIVDVVNTPNCPISFTKDIMPLY